MKFVNYEKLDPIHVTDPNVPSILGRFIDADSYSQESESFCVTDGVTRDLRNDDVFGKPSNIREAFNTLRFFPQMSLLRRAAKLCACTFTSSDRAELAEILKQVNCVLRRFNQKNLKHGPNFLGNDLFGVVAAGGVIVGNELRCFNVADSNIMVLDSHFDLIHKTNDDFAKGQHDRHRSMTEIYPDLTWKDNEYRKTFRSLYRNSDIKGSFGTLNGEKEALNHIKYYDFNLEKAKYIVAYTDGFNETMETEKKRKDLLLLKKYKLEKEGTLIRYKKIL